MRKLFNGIKAQILKSEILKNAFSVFYLQTIASLIGLLNTFLIIKAIGINGLGTIAILTTYVNFYIGVFSFYSYTAVIKFGQEAIVNKDILGLKKYFKRALLLDILSSVATLIIAYLLINITSSYFGIGQQTQKYIVLYLVLIPFSVIRTVTAVLRLSNDYKSEPFVAIVTSIVKMLVILFGLFYALPIQYFIITDIIISIIGSIMLAFFGYRCLKKIKCLDFYKVKLTPDKEFIRFNLYNNFASTLNLPIGQLTNFIINKLLGVDAVGIFNVISKFGGIFNQVISALTQSLFPELSRLVALKEFLKALKIVEKTFLIMVSGGVIASVVFMISYPIWLHYFIPATFYNGTLLSTYTIYMALVGAVAGVHLLFTSLNLVRYNIPLVLFCNSVYIILLLILPNKLGLLGVIIALILQTTMMASLKYFIIKKKNKSANY